MAFGFFKKKEDSPVAEAAASPSAAGSTGTSPPASTAGGSGGTGTAGGTGAGGDTGVNPEPAKARRFFEHAQAMHEASNFEYATTLWLQGLRCDPTSVSGLEAFAKSASAFVGSSPKIKGPTKDQSSNFSGSKPVERYLRALLEWGTRPMDWQQGLKAFETAVKLKLTEPAYWIGSRVLGIAGEDPKAKKDSFVTLMGLFAEIGGYDKAVIAGEIAVRLDPTDGRLAAEVKNMSAQATMSKGGYEQSGQAGGFRANVRDIKAQREREEEERIDKTEDTQARVIERARDDYESRPSDIAAIQKLAKLLIERGLPEDEKLAFHVLLKGFNETKNYRFKQMAGDLNLRVARRQVREMKESLAADPDNAEKKKQVAQVERQLMQMEVAEFQERVANNPTDYALRYELGKRLLELGQNEQAIEQFQQARGAPGLLTHVMQGLGMAFARLGWLDEAESSYRDAVAAYEVTTDDLAADLRYGLMDVLERKARENSDLSAAEEAFRLASGIAVQRINFRDIRARRQGLQELVKSLKGA